MNEAIALKKPDVEAIREGGAPVVSLPVAAVPEFLQDRSSRAVANTPSESESVVRKLDPAKTVMIPAGVRIEGDIATDGKAAVVVYGEVVGTVSAGEQLVHVASGGAVTGMIESRSEVLVSGKVSGGDANGVCIKTSQRFVLGASGRVDGDVMYGSMRIYDGVVAGRLLPFTDDASPR